MASVTSWIKTGKQRNLNHGWGMFEEQNFEFESLPYENGALLYFKAVLRD